MFVWRAANFPTHHQQSHRFNKGTSRLQPAQHGPETFTCAPSQPGKTLKTSTIMLKNLALWLILSESGRNAQARTASVGLNGGQRSRRRCRCEPAGRGRRGLFTFRGREELHSQLHRSFSEMLTNMFTCQQRRMFTASRDIHFRLRSVHVVKKKTTTSQYQQ